jgi:hypothetical protein
MRPLCSRTRCPKTFETASWATARSSAYLVTRKPQQSESNVLVREGCAVASVLRHLPMRVPS